MASVYIDLPLRSVGTLSAPGLASEATLNGLLTEVQGISAVIREKTVHQRIEFDYGSTNVANTGYVQILAATTGDIVSMTLFDASGRAMVLAIGASSLEVDYLYIPPGGFNGVFPVQIPSGSRLSVKCLDSSPADAGKLISNLYKQV